MSDELTYRITGRRIEFFFRGSRIASGLERDSHKLECLKAIRTILGHGKLTDGNPNVAAAIWEARRAVQ